MPTISVIVPVYKVEPYLERCVKSILTQTFTDFQLILVDDGSPDRCGQLCDDFAKEDKRIHVIHQTNQGLSAARNAGIDCALSGDSQWLSFIDSDDWIHPRFLEILLEAARGNESRMASCRWQKVFREEEVVPPEDFSVELLPPEELYCSQENDFGIDSYAWRLLYHRDLFQDVRYPINKNWEDLRTTYKLLFQCNKVAHTQAAMYYYFLRDDSITRLPWHPARLEKIHGLEDNIIFFRDSQRNQLYERLKRCYAAIVEKERNFIRDSSLSPEEKLHWLKVLDEMLSRIQKCYP